MSLFDLHFWAGILSGVILTVVILGTSAACSSSTPEDESPMEAERRRARLRAENIAYARSELHGHGIPFCTKRFWCVLPDDHEGDCCERV